MFKSSIKKQIEKKFLITMIPAKQVVKVINRSIFRKVGDGCLILHPSTEFSPIIGDQNDDQRTILGLLQALKQISSTKLLLSLYT